ncbi:hypothetical protein [Mesorhizobium sp. CAU 1741]|uniref:hypothetical protein n=1 Tax=Mesorhizobium sp. CAU 1741 TaxID=3140366 RepID=UPI00325B77D9
MLDRSRREGWQRAGHVARMCLATAIGFAATPAAAQENWVALESEARAMLPAASGGAVTGGSLSCEAQRWTLRLDLGDAAERAGGAAVIAVDGRAFDLVLSVEGRTLVSPLPREMLEPLKKGIRMVATLPGEAGEITFPLRGSNAAISGAENRCTLRDMSAYTAITFTPYSSHANLARELRAKDIEAFAASTASQPEVTVAMTELGAGRRLLFTRLCGSSWYYGLSGCNITGFATEPRPEGDASPDWTAVYDTENVHLHLDPKSLHDGWPDVVTLPVRGGGAALVWRWDGEGYALEGELPEESEQDDMLSLRPSQD